MLLVVHPSSTAASHGMRFVISQKIEAVESSKHPNRSGINRNRGTCLCDPGKMYLTSRLVDGTLPYSS